MILLIVLLTIYSSLASEKKEAQLIPLKLPLELEKPTYYLEKVKDKVGKTVVQFSEEIDSFFVGNPEGKVLNSSQVNIFWLVDKTMGEEVSHTPGIGLRLVLPRTEKKLQFVIDNKSKEISEAFSGQDEQSVEKPTSTASSSSSGSFFTASVLYVFEQKRNWNIYMDAGVKVGIPLHPFIGIAGGKVFPLKKGWILKANGRFVWAPGDGWSEGTTVNIDHPLSQNLLFRFGNSLNWIDKTGSLTTHHGPRLYHKIDDKKALNYYLSVQSQKGPRLHVYDYNFGSTFRHLIYKTWVYYEVGAKGSFPKGKNWRFVPSVFAKLEMFFGGN